MLQCTGWLMIQNESYTVVPLTSHPPETCQAPKGTHVNIFRTWGNTHKSTVRVVPDMSYNIHQRYEVLVWFYLSWTPGLSSCLISAMTALGSKDLVFSSTQFSGSKSVDARPVWTLVNWFDTVNVFFLFVFNIYSELQKIFIIKICFIQTLNDSTVC